MSTLIFRFDGDGHKPRVSRTGDLVAWGNTTLRVVHVRNPRAVWYVGEGRALRFLDDERITWVKPLSNTAAKRYVDNLNMFVGGIPQIDDINLVGGNDFEAANGHWASVLVSTGRLTYDGEEMKYGVRAVRMCGEYMLTVENNYFCVYRNGVLERQHPLQPTANEFRISEEGWISYGYFGPSRIITPDGAIHQINITPLESMARIVHLPNGDVWAWTTTVVELNKALVIGRPLRFLTNATWKSDEECVQLEFPAESIDVSWWEEKQSFTVAGAANLGNTTPLEVHVVPYDYPRKKLVIPTPQPEPEPQPEPGPEPEPQPPDEDDMDKAEIIRTFDYDVPQDIYLGALDQFIANLLPKDRISNAKAEDNETTEERTLTRGAMMFFNPQYYRGVNRWIAERERIPNGPNEWGDASMKGLTRAIALYNREIKGEGSGNSPFDPGVSGELTPLTVRGRLFYNASGPFDYREISGFGLFERFRNEEYDHCKAFASFCRRYKITAVRVILTLGGSYWENVIGLTSGPDKPHFFNELKPFADFMNSEGLYVRFTLLGGLESFGGFSHNREDVYRDDVHNRVVDYVNHVMDRIANEPNVLWEVANEWNQIGMRDSDRRIVELGRLVKSRSERPMNLTNTNGPIADDPMWAREPADFVDAHLERWTQVGGFSWVKRSSESPVVDDHDMLMISGEAINFGTPQPGRPDDAEPSPAVAFAYGATSRTKRYVTNFHYHGGLAALIPDDATIACVEGWMRGLDAIPLTFPGDWCNGHHGCSPWDINIFPREGENEDRHTRGPIRIFGLSGGEGYIGVSIAERAGAGVPAHRRPVQEVDRVTYGDYSSAVYRA